MIHLRKLRTIRLAVLATLVVLGSLASVSPASAQVSPPVEATICEDAGGVIVRLYRAYFNRVPDQPGLRYWGEIYKQKGSLKTVAYWMAQSDEYQNRWKGYDSRQWVTELLYNNLLQRNPDTSGLDYWVGVVNQIPRDEQVLYWVIQPETMAKHPVTKPAFCGGSGDGDGYSFTDIPGGRAVTVDYQKIDLKSSASRCGIASINANWLIPSGPEYGKAVGFAAINGAAIANTGDDASRGILGERIRPDGPQDEFSWAGLKMLSNLDQKDGHVLELHSNYWIDSIFGESQTNWRWAVGGITLVTDGQVTAEMPNDYTFGTSRHSFAAFKAPSTVMFGSTTQMTAFQLIDWLAAHGYTDVMKMDGGGSVEFNEYGRTTVAGTSRPIPVWLGIGC